MLTRAATEIASIATLIVISLPLGLVAALLGIAIISCHLGGAGLVPRRFELLFRVLVTNACNISDFLFPVVVTMLNRFTLSNCRLTFTAFVCPKGLL